VYISGHQQEGAGDGTQKFRHKLLPLLEHFRMEILAMALEIESGFIEITVHRTEQAIVISLAGELDVAGAPLVQEHLLDAAQSGVPEVVCDLGDLAYLDSAGISVLISARKRLKATGRDLVLCRPSERVRKVLEVSGVVSYFPIRQR
jgi:anti-sigma B factor antagonist